jgi:hypothetical protein
MNRFVTANRTLAQLLLGTLLVSAAAHLLLFLPLPPSSAVHLLQALGALTVAGFVPGALLVQALVGQGASPPHWAERILYSIGAAYAVMVGGMLLASYWPGGPTFALTLGVFDALSIGLAAVIGWRARRGEEREEKRPRDLGGPWDGEWCRTRPRDFQSP